MISYFTKPLGAVLGLATLFAAASESALEIKPGDHVVWVGNTFAERMQYFGEVEAHLHARYPKHELVVRNIAWPADTVSLRPRPEKFGDIHHYLSTLKADVILACYGFNETWDYDGENGTDRFRADLSAFLMKLKEHQYNGESAAKIVLYSPIACEGTRVPNTVGRNSLIKLYTGIMAETAAEHEIAFVDLFTPSLDLFRADSLLTINGMHLTAEGYAKIAPAIWDERLFAKRADSEQARLTSIKKEVMEKNDTFFEWYRTVNSLYIHGERKGPHGFFEKERVKLLQMAAIRDQRIWKAARGESIPETIDDSSTVQIPKVVSGRKSGISKALSPEEEYAKFKIADGFKVDLFASEQTFPELRNPVAMKFDAKGRLWIATMPSYPHAFPGREPNDQLIILEDTDGDGKADKRSIFADKLYLPLGFEFGNGGVYVSQEPNLVFLEDTDDDGKADKETILFHGFGTEDSHHAIHDFVWGPGGGLYMSESTFQNTQVETNRGPKRAKDNTVYRFDPRTQQLDIVCRMPSGGNPWGHAINAWGEQLFIGRHLNVALINQPKHNFDTNAPNNITDDTRFCGQEFISSNHWPAEFQGKVFSNRYKDLQGVLLHDWTEDGSTYSHMRLEAVIDAQNKAFIPVDVKLGPDGALYVADWYNPVLGHMQYSLRHKSRDSNLGRIWRITYEGRPLDSPAKIAGASVTELLNNLKAYENSRRYRTRRALWHLADDVLRPALDKWIADLDPKNPNLPQHLSEALWLHQQRGWINESLFQRVATSPEPRARATAARLIRYWFDDLPNSTKHILSLAADDHLKVRLESVVSSTWIDPSVAVQVLEIISDLPQDENLKVGFGYAQRALKPVLKNHPMLMPPAELARQALSDQVVKALIRRPGLDPALRQKVLAHLSSERNTLHLPTLVSIISDLEKRGDASLEDWLVVLDKTDTTAISASAASIQPLLSSGKTNVRQAGYAALLRSGIQQITATQDVFYAINRLSDPLLQKAYWSLAKEVLENTDANPDLRRAALFALGRIPGSNDDIFSSLATYLSKDDFTAAAAEALLARGSDTWPTDPAKSTLTSQLLKLEATPVQKRGEDSFQLASKVLTAIAKHHRMVQEQSRISSLQLRIAKIAAIPDHLSFDRETFEVKAGTPVELRFNNPDAIAHNLVISLPGSMEKTGFAVDALLGDPNAMKRDWIPDLPEVLFHTPMAAAESTVVVRFIAPSKTGKYPFICTVPGHWRVMKGNMIVVP